VLHSAPLIDAALSLSLKAVRFEASVSLEMKEAADQGRPLSTDGRSGAPRSLGRAANDRRGGTHKPTLE
jgi:hypothetical protein